MLLESSLLPTLAVLIEFGGAVVVIVHVMMALGLLALRRGSIERARLVVVEGALSGLGFKVAATLIKTIELRSAEQIAMFAAILALRTFVKAALNRDRRALTSTAR